MPKPPDDPRGKVRGRRAKEAEEELEEELGEFLRTHAPRGELQPSVDLPKPPSPPKKERLKPTFVDFDAVRDLQKLSRAVDVTLSPLIDWFRRLLTSLEGKNFGSYEDNRTVAVLVQETADKLRVVLLCPKCGEPSRLRCSKDAKVVTGLFSFSHGRSTHGGSSTLSALECLAPPPPEKPE